MFLQAHLDFFIPIIILLGLATLASILIKVLKLPFLPVFAVEIFIGLIISHWFNNYMQELHLEHFIEGIYTLGLSLLIFLSGYEVEFDIAEDLSINQENDCKACKRRRCLHCKYINILKVAIRVTLLTYVAALIVSIAFSSHINGNKILGIILLTLVFASTFAGLVVPIIHDLGLHHAPIGKTIATISDLSEALSIIFLTIFMILVEVEREYLFIFALIALIILTFGIFRKYRVGKLFSRITEGIDHLATRFIIILILVFVLLSNLAGGEYILGAFVAGIFVRRAKFSPNVIHSLERIIYGIFTPMFYILVGTKIDIINLLSSWESVGLVLLLALALILVELPVLYLLRWYKLKSVLPSILMLSCTIIVPLAAKELNESLHLFSHEFADSLILASLIICIIGTIFFSTRLPFGTHQEIKETVHEQ